MRSFLVVIEYLDVYSFIKVLCYLGSCNFCRFERSFFIEFVEGFGVFLRSFIKGIIVGVIVGDVMMLEFLLFSCVIVIFWWIYFIDKKFSGILFLCM